MSISKRPVPRPPRAGLLGDLAGVLRSLGVTYAKLLEKPVAPDEAPAAADDVAPLTGGLRLLTTASGQLKCVACGLCTHVCPSQCLTVVAEVSSSGKLAPARFELDELRCTGCALCVQVCPEDALDMNGPLAQPVGHRLNAISDKVSLLRGGTKSPP